MEIHSEGGGLAVCETNAHRPLQSSNQKPAAIGKSELRRPDPPSAALSFAPFYRRGCAARTLRPALPSSRRSISSTILSSSRAWSAASWESLTSSGSRLETTCSRPPAARKPVRCRRSTAPPAARCGWCFRSSSANRRNTGTLRRRAARPGGAEAGHLHAFHLPVGRQIQ